MKLFEINNANADALVIPQEQGGSDDDNYFGSIGDAVAKHVNSLSNAERQLWQELITARSGKIYKVVPSFKAHDPDVFKLRGESDLDEHKAILKSKFGNKIDQTTIDFLDEIFEAEEEIRAESEDIHDFAERIPYHLMEQFPGMEKHIEIPSTPRDYLFYMGNVNQQFYDVFPEGHPDADIVNRYIMMMNRDDTDEGYMQWIQEKILEEFCSDYIKKHLCELAEKLDDWDNDANECVHEALAAIDEDWRLEYRRKTATLCTKDSLLMLIVHKNNEWNNQAVDGFNIYSSVKEFGQILFTNFKDQMKSHHWARYRKIKKHFSPRVIVHGYDINRCNIQDLKKSLRLDDDRAKLMWFARPFENLGQAYKQNFINSSAFSCDEVTDKLIGDIEQAYQFDLQASVLESLPRLRHKLMKLQQDKKPAISSGAWRMIWAYYRTMFFQLNDKSNYREE